MKKCVYLFLFVLPFISSHVVICADDRKLKELEDKVYSSDNILTVKGDYLSLALEYSQRGQIEKGLLLLKTFIDTYPNDPERNTFSTYYNKYSFRQLNKTIPNFREKTIDGTSFIELNTYRGKVVLLDFWASWCLNCLNEFEELRKIYEAYHTRGFEIIGICLNEGEEKNKAEQILKKFQIQWPNVFDGKGYNSPLTVAYGITQLPYSYLISKEGKIVAVKKAHDEDLIRQIEEQLR